MRTEVLRLGKDKVCVGNQWTENKSNKTNKKKMLILVEII